MKLSTSLKENFEYYLDESGIHGFSYLHPRKHFISRLFWVGLKSIIILISNNCSLNFFSYGALFEFLDNYFCTLPVDCCCDFFCGSCTFLV